MRALNTITILKTHPVTINIVILLYGMFCDKHLRLSFIVRIDLSTDLAFFSLVKMSTLASRILVFKHLNYLSNICPVTLKDLDLYHYIPLITPCRIVLFTVELVLSMLRNLILRIFEVRRGIPFMKSKSHPRVISLCSLIIFHLMGPN